MTDLAEQALAGHTVVCGLGHVGQRVAALVARLGQPLSIVTLPTDRERHPSVPDHVPIVWGDARDERRLGEAGLRTARAVIAVTDDDRVNVSIALDAKRLNPGIIVVARLFDQRLAPLLERSLGVRRALSASALAAPAFVAAALGGAVRAAFDLEESHGLLEMHAVAAGDADTLMALRGRLERAAPGAGTAVVAHQRNGHADLRPRDDAHLEVDDRVLTVRLAPRECPARNRPSGYVTRSLATFSLGLRNWWRETPFALRGVLGALSAIVLASVAFFHLSLGLSPVDALYFVVTTVTTTGYGDISLLAAPTYVKLFGVLVMLAGAALFAVVFSLVTDLLLRTRLADVLAHGRARRRGHVVVAGLGNIGYRVVRELSSRGQSVVAIERDGAAEFVDAARALATVMIGDAHTEETLQRAGLSEARSVVAVTDDDLANLGIGLAAKQARRDCRAIVRVFDAQLAEKMQDRLGVEAVLSMSAVAAPAFVAAALCAEAVHGVVIGDHLLVLYRHVVGVAHDAAADCQPSEDRVLLCQPPGERRFRPLAPGERPPVGAVLLGLRGFALTTPVAPAP